MNREHPDTLDQQPQPDTLPGFGAADPAQSGKPGKHWFLWLVLLLLVGAGAYYYFHSRANLAKTAARDSGKEEGARGRFPWSGAGAKGDIGVYFTGLGAVTPIYTVTVKSQISGYLTQVLYTEGQTVHKGEHWRRSIHGPTK